MLMLYLYTLHKCSIYNSESCLSCITVVVVLYLSSDSDADSVKERNYVSDTFYKSK